MTHPLSTTAFRAGACALLLTAALTGGAAAAEKTVADLQLSQSEIRALYVAQDRVLRQSDRHVASGCLDQGNAACIAGHSGPHRQLGPLIDCFVTVAKQCSAQAGSALETAN